MVMRVVFVPTPDHEELLTPVALQIVGLELDVARTLAASLDG